MPRCTGELENPERRDLARYKLYDRVIYSSEAAKRHLDKSLEATQTGSALGLAKGVMHLALTDFDTRFRLVIDRMTQNFAAFFNTDEATVRRLAIAIGIIVDLVTIGKCGRG